LFSPLLSRQWPGLPGRLWSKGDVFDNPELSLVPWTI
jgi:hypothetical protein